MMIIDFDKNYSEIIKKVLNGDSRLQGESKDENQAKLSSLLKESELIVLNEMAKNAANERINNARQRKRRICEMTIDAITQGVKYNIGERFELTFGRPEIDSTTSRVLFYFKRVRMLTKDWFIIEGECRASRSPYSLRKVDSMNVGYRFSDLTFYQVTYCKDGTIMNGKKLKLRFNGVYGMENVRTAMNLIQYLTMCLCHEKENSKEDY